MLFLSYEKVKLVLSKEILSVEIINLTFSDGVSILKLMDSNFW